MKENSIQEIGQTMKARGSIRIQYSVINFLFSSSAFQNFSSFPPDEMYINMYCNLFISFILSEIIIKFVLFTSS